MQSCKTYRHVGKCLYAVDHDVFFLGGWDHLDDKHLQTCIFDVFAYQAQSNRSAQGLAEGSDPRVQAGNLSSLVVLQAEYFSNRRTDKRRHRCRSCTCG